MLYSLYIYFPLRGWGGVGGGGGGGGDMHVYNIYVCYTRILYTYSIYFFCGLCTIRA